jgi:hypothetical protein
LVWDLTELGVDADGRLNSSPLDDAQLALLWIDLVTMDGQRAYRATWKLVAGNEQGILS